MIKYIWTVYMDYFYWLHGGSAIFTILWALWRSRIRSRPKIKKVCVLVLGDIGRSPRMQYHALSFAKEGLDVDLVGYPGSEPLLELREHAKVKIHYLRPPPDLQRLPRLVRFVIKTLWQSVTLLYKLCKDIRTGTLIVQNPPAVPTLPICWAYAHCSATEFIIDWHNYAHTIMGLTVGKEHILTKMTKHIESFFGCVADRHFCVTEAMRKDLRKWSITLEIRIFHTDTTVT